MVVEDAFGAKSSMTRSCGGNYSGPLVGFLGKRGANLAEPLRGRLLLLQDRLVTQRICEIEIIVGSCSLWVGGLRGGH